MTLVWARGRALGPLPGTDLLNCQEIGSPLGAGSPAIVYSVWRGPNLIGRVVDWSDYEAGDRLFVAERIRDGGFEEVETGVVAHRIEIALEILAGEPIKREPREE